MLVCLYKSGEICPFAIIFCIDIREIPEDNTLVIIMDLGYEMMRTDYDYYHVYDLDTDEKMDGTAKLLQDFVKSMEKL